jgi:hypothetical protein
MFTPLPSALVSIRSWFRTRAALQLENLALRHQLIVLSRTPVTIQETFAPALCLPITPTVLKCVDVQRSRLLIFPPHANRVSFLSVHFVFLFPNPRLSASRESCPAPPDQRTATGWSEAAPPEVWRSSLMGLPVAFMDGLALSTRDRQARNGDSLAPQVLSSVLDLEMQTRASW